MPRSEVLTRIIEREIADRRLPAGYRFGTRADLRRRFNVAMATVNESIRVLEMRKIVEARPGPGGGVFVAASASSDDVDDEAATRSLHGLLEILVAFREQRQLTTADAAAAARVSPIGALRLMNVLAEHGLVATTGDGEVFAAGPDLVHLGLAVVRDLELRTHLHPFIELLSHDVGETVHVVVRQGRDVFFLDSVEGRHAIRAGSRTGRAMPAHATAGGKALLAELSAVELRQLYPKRTLPKSLPATIGARAELEAALAHVSECGYATNLAETEPDLGVVATVVRDASGVARCAIGIAGPLSRVNEFTIAALAVPLLRIAGDASKALAARTI
jgi:DNA-binding IclR family transcriptional regulator